MSDVIKFRIGVLTAVVAIIIQLSGVVWVARGVLASVEQNNAAILVNKLAIEHISQEQRKRSQRVYQIDYLASDIAEIKTEIKEIRKRLGQ